MNHLVIGMGQIGSAVATVLLGGGYDVSMADIATERLDKTIDVLHICFGYSDEFVQEVKKYQKAYQPRLIIIYSTVPIGTTKCVKSAVHSPVEGKHPRLSHSIKVGLRFIGYNDNQDKVLAQNIWRPITVCESLPNSDWTEFLKLASTSKYGINIVWADYMANVAGQLEMPYNYVKDWDKAYNELYGKLKMKHNRKFVLDPPDGKIGGHCVVPNAELLDNQFPHCMLKQIKAMK